MADITPKPFDPARYLIKLKGKDYLEVKWRIVWFRDVYQHGVITTQIHSITQDHAVVTARVEDGEGGVGSGIGSESVKDFGDFIEKAECVPLRSRILTRDGFKNVYDLSMGEDVLAYDHETDTNVWTPLLEAKVYEAAPTIALTNKWGYRLECTPDHTWPIRQTGNYKRKSGSDFKLRQARSINTSDMIVLAAPAPGGDSPITPDEAAIIGWLFTDGTIKRRKDGTASVGIITQSKPQHIERIKELVGSISTLTVSKPYIATIAQNPHPSECKPQHAFALPAAITRSLFAKAGIQTDADLPALATRLSVKSREAMYAAMMDADGNTAKRTFSKKRRPGTMEAWRVLNTLAGRAISPIHMRDHDMPNQRERKTRHMYGSQIVMQDAGKQTVWCPTTAYGTWVMEQDGQVAITGNTKAIGRALAALGFGTQFAPELEEGERIANAPVDRGTRQQPTQIDRASIEQKNMIVGLGKRLGMVKPDGHHDGPRLDESLRKRVGAPLSGLTKKQASNVIDMMQTAINATQPRPINTAPPTNEEMDAALNTATPGSLPFDVPDAERFTR